MFEKFKMILAQNHYRNNRCVKLLSERQFIKKYSTQIESVEGLFFQYDYLVISLNNAKFLSMVFQSICKSPSLCNELSMLLTMNGANGTKPIPVLELIAGLVSHAYAEGTFKLSDELLHYIYMDYFGDGYAQ